MTDADRAKKLLTDGRYTCVLIRGVDVVTSKERGIKPLIAFIDGKKDLRGYTAADRIVGKAAALLYALIGVRQVYAEVMSKDAVRALESRKIAFSYDTLTDRIINRRGDDICPMERAVANIDTPSAALSAIKSKLSRL